MNGIGAFVSASLCARAAPGEPVPARLSTRVATDKPVDAPRGDTWAAERRSRPAWHVAAALGVIAGISYFFLNPVPQALLYGGVGITSGVVMIVAARRMPRGRTAWYLFALTQFLWAAGDLIWSGYDFVLHQAAPYPSVADWLYLAGYPLAMCGIVLHVRRQVKGSVRHILMDATIVGVLAGLAAWQGIVRPYIVESGLLGSGDLVGLAYPILDLALLAVSAALLLGPGGRTVSNRLMIVAIGGSFFADIMYSAGILDGTYRSGIWYDAGWLLSYAVWGVAALHPSARAEPVTVSPGIPYAHLRLILATTFILMGVLISDILRDIPISLLAMVIGGGGVFALSIVRMQGLMRELHERLVRVQDSEQALRHSEERFRKAFESSAAGVVLTSLTGNFLQVNKTFAEMVDRRDDDLVGQAWSAVVHSDDQAWTVEQLERLATGHADECYGEMRLLHATGRPVWVGVSLGLVRDEVGDPQSIVAHVVDESHAKELEDSLSRSQKMEAVGQLAGGVAHDFNNLLSVIQNYTRFVHDDLPPGDPNRDDLGEVLKAGERGASLVHQLLTFSRRERTSPRVLDLNELIGDMSNLLQKSLRESVELKLKLTSSPPHVEIDPTQLEQVLLNLALNARDAMPIGGEFVVQTKIVEVESTDASKLGLAMGEYVQLCISDNGGGMSEEVRARAFEPFFTTKERGAGTGLGLATVYGTVTRARGTVLVESEPGFGTTFEIYLPHVAPSRAVQDEPVHHDRPFVGTESILVVEDEEGIRRIVERVLTNHGYDVVIAETPRDAIAMAEQPDRRIDLLVTDVVMPQLSGKEVAERIRVSRPDLRVLYMSGYTDEVMAQHGLVADGEDYLPKPFTAEDLLLRVRGTLDDVLLG